MTRSRTLEILCAFTFVGCGDDTTQTDPEAIPIEITVDHYRLPCDVNAEGCFRIDAGDGFVTSLLPIQGLEYTWGRRYRLRVQQSTEGYRVQEVLSTDAFLGRFVMLLGTVDFIENLDETPQILGRPVPLKESQRAALRDLGESVELTLVHAEVGFKDVEITGVKGCTAAADLALICGAPCTCPESSPDEPACEDDVLRCPLGDGLIGDCAGAGPDGFSDCPL